MLHTKFQGHWSIGSGGEDFLRFLSRSTQGNNLNNLGSTFIDNATYKVSRSWVYWFWRRRFIKVFTIYEHGGHVGHVTHLYLKVSYEFWFQIAQLFLLKTTLKSE